jgi:hypothetical protein
MVLDPLVQMVAGIAVGKRVEPSHRGHRGPGNVNVTGFQTGATAETA